MPFAWGEDEYDLTQLASKEEESAAFEWLVRIAETELLKTFRFRVGLF